MPTMVSGATGWPGSIDMPWLRIKPIFLFSGHLLAGLRVSVAPAEGCSAQEADDLPPNTRVSVLRRPPNLPAGGTGTAQEIASLASRVAS